MFDLIINNAHIYDGTGGASYMGSVAVKDGKIVAVSRQPLEGAREVIDAQGLALSPGFIDAHSHADYAVFTDPHRLHVLRMGVTTEIAGQCGVSNSPVLEAMRYICLCDPKRLFGFQVGEGTLEQLGQLSEAYLTTQLERGFSALDFYKSLLI